MVDEDDEGFDLKEFLLAYLKLVTYISFFGLAFYFCLMIHKRFFYTRDTTLDNAMPPKKEDIVKKIRANYKLDVCQFREHKIPIKSLWLYPIRGIKGMKRD
jgi:hypothetical protein